MCIDWVRRLLLSTLDSIRCFSRRGLILLTSPLAEKDACARHWSKQKKKKLSDLIGRADSLDSDLDPLSMSFRMPTGAATVGIPTLPHSGPSYSHIPRRKFGPSLRLVMPRLLSAVAVSSLILLLSVVAVPSSAFCATSNNMSPSAPPGQSRPRMRQLRLGPTLRLSPQATHFTCLDKLRLIRRLVKW